MGGDILLRVLDEEGPQVLGEVPAHRALLALRSPVFRGILYKSSGCQADVKVVELKMSTMKAVNKMLEYIYFKPTAKKGYWLDSNPVEIFQVVYLAQRYKLPGLQKKIVKHLESFPLAQDEVMETARTAEQFLTVFPEAAEALLSSCTSVLGSRLLATEDFIQFAGHLSSQPEYGALGVKLMARLQRKAGGRNEDDKPLVEADDNKTSNGNKNTVAMQLIKSTKPFTNAEVVLPSFGLELGQNVKIKGDAKEKCSNCKLLKKHCLDGKPVHYILPGSAKLGCKVISSGPFWGQSKKGQVAAVVGVLSEGRVMVRWENICTIADTRYNDGEKTRRGGGGPFRKQEIPYFLKAKVAHALGEPVFFFYCKLE